MNRTTRWIKERRQVNSGGSLVCTAFNCIQYTHFVSHRVDEVVPSTTLWFIGRKPAQRGWNGRANGCLHLFLTWYPPVVYRLHSTTNRSVVRSQFPLCARILCEVRHPLLNTFLSRKGRSRKIVVRNCFRYLWQKQKQENNLPQFA